ncbi:MAG: hypothetical protein E7562_04125 [Ruminococcaceae bacterium]|nr:hypothetical protein [Oscillospiraceae bacterium]
MKKIWRSFFLLIIAVIVVVSSLNIVSFAAGNTVLGINNKSPKVGDTVVITVTIRANEAMYATEAYLSYDKSVLKFENGTSANTDGDKIKIVGTPGGNDNQSYNLNFTVIAAGKSGITVSDASYVGQDMVSVTGSSFTLTVEEDVTSSTPSDTPSDTTSTPPSSNANLASLKVSGGTLSPKFDANTTSYTVTVANDVKKTTITATTADKDAKINGAGNINLNIGDNKRIITVTATDGTKKVYNLIIKRLSDEEPDDTSSDSTTSENPSEPSDPYAVMIDGVLYRIQTDLSGLTPPIGYNQTEIAYNGVTIPVYTDSGSKMMLYSLKSDSSEGDAQLYIYDSVKKQFKKIEFIETNDRFYIFTDLEKNVSAPSGFYEKHIEIEGKQIKAFAYKDNLLRDFYVVYCYTDGKYEYYRYDSKEQTLQRFPEFAPVISEETDAPVSSNDSEDAGLLEKFSALPENGKIVIIAIIIAAVSIIALIILLVIFIINRRDEDYKEGAFSTEDYGYDYSVDDAVPFDTVTKDITDTNTTEPQDE